MIAPEANLSVSELERRAAIALNNNAVTLLQRNCFLQALDTFRSALCFIERSRCPESTKGLAKQRMQRAITRSHQLLIHATPSPKSPSSDFEIVLDNCRGILNDIKSLDRVHPIRFDDVNNVGEPCSCEQYANNGSYEASIILYNYGLAHFCLARSQHKSDHGETAKLIKKNAAKLFQLSSSIVNTELETENDDDCWIEHQLSILNLAILSMLIRVLHELQETTNLASLIEELEINAAIYQETYTLLTSYSSGIACAAAA